MTRLGFYLARLLRQEGPIAALSIPQEQVLATLRGRRVALIGNARSLAEAQHGERIDSADLVIRINRAPMPYAQSHGIRTDWLAMATRLDANDRARIAPTRILWMSPKRKRLDWLSASSPGFYLHPLADYLALKTRLGASPTTGAMMIDLIARSRMAQLDLFGFDFFASLSLSGRRSADQVPHDFSAEAQWVRRLMLADRRIALH